MLIHVKRESKYENGLNAEQKTVAHNPEGMIVSDNYKRAVVG